MIKLDPTDVKLEVYELLIEKSVLKSYKKGSILTAYDRVCHHLFFVEKGFLRTFFYDNKGNEITHWFASEAMIITSPSSFFNREISAFTIEALEDCEVRAITLDALESVFEQSHSLERFGRLMITSMLIMMGNKVIDLQTKSAEERYVDLINNHPDIFRRAKLGHIASFLGIAQQSLSRIRANVKL